MKHTSLPVVFILALASAVVADVKGQFKVDKTTITPGYDGAYLVHDQFNGRQMQVEMILSEAAVDIKAAVAELSPHSQIINQPEIMDANYILLWIDPDGKVSMNAKAAGVQYIDSTEGGLKVELKTNTLERVAGRVYTPNPVKTLSGPVFEVDLTFDTAVTKSPAGKALPAGGGDPGKALMDLQKAMSKDLAALNSLLTQETIDRLQDDYNTPEENFKGTVDILNAWLPKQNWKVTRGELIDDATAILEVEGDMFEDTQAVYLARMKKTDTGWKFAKATVAGMIK